MGKLLDRMLAEATEAPWLTPVDPLRAPKGSIQSHAAGRDRPLPAPYNRRGATREAEVLRACLAALAVRRIWHRRIDSAGKIVWAGGEGSFVPGSNRGLPDILACLAGALVGLEVKAPGGKVSAVQLATLRAMADAGARVAIVCDAELLGAWLDGGPATAELEGIAVV